jgi:GT2 family glycosyltransferase
MKLNSNLGFGKANNIGFEFALSNAYDHVFLLNQDAWVARGSIGDLVRLQQENAEYGIVSPIHLNGDGESLDNLFGKYISPMFCPGLYSDALLGKLKELYVANFVNAAAWLISKKCLSVVGGFDPIYQHYGEDNDFAQRAISRGFKIGVTPNVFICHDRPQRIYRTGDNDVYREYVANLAQLKRPDWSTRFAVATVVKRLIGIICTSAFVGEFNRSLKFTRVLRKICTNLPKVVDSRRQMTREVCPYLSLAVSGTVKRQ